MVASDRWIWTPWRITPTDWYTLLKAHGATDATLSNDASPEYVITTVPVTEKFRWIAALALPIPLLGYAVFFFILPWIVRGFHSHT